jgi:hypothetical protein
LVSAGDRGGAVEYFFTRMIGMPAEAVEPMRASPFWPDLEELAPTLVYDAAVMGDSSLPLERIAKVSCPTLVLAGESGDPRLRRAAEALWAVLPDAQHRSLLDQTHDVDPNVLAPELEDFFSAAPMRAQLGSQHT